MNRHTYINTQRSDRVLESSQSKRRRMESRGLNRYGNRENTRIRAAESYQEWSGFARTHRGQAYRARERAYESTLSRLNVQSLSFAARNVKRKFGLGLKAAARGDLFIKSARAPRRIAIAADWNITRQQWYAQHFETTTISESFRPVRLVIIGHSVSAECFTFIVCAAELRSLQGWFISYHGWDIP
ncbi:hypothetical protein EVAR_60371_1 [Eumeta japonica]|uniref:Uncharacterized protein n=1 Tax=Eumeta variegata TaxID=151549 RepID=A0A4C1SIL7_EUMVA|nr:hypothetical protein EVAR_60371_1 [Eumeta japonica]